MENLMKTEWLALINKKRNKTYPEWTDPPVVLTEDTTEKIFDIIDTKDCGDPIVRLPQTGQATYFNGNDQITYPLRFIKSEEFLNQFVKRDSITGEEKNWSKGLSRPDYMAYDLSSK